MTKLLVVPCDWLNLKARITYGMVIQKKNISEFALTISEMRVAMSLAFDSIEVVSKYKDSLHWLCP